MTRVLCTLADLDATGCKEIVLERDSGRFPVFVARFAGRIFGYANSCPHARMPLNWREDEFFDVTGTFLFCTSHGAQFDPVTGNCICGPCKGQRLTTFLVRVEGETIVAEGAIIAPTQ